MTNEMIKTYSYRISQATRSQLVVITYDIIGSYLEDALGAKQEDKNTFRESLRGAMRGIDQLATGLDMNYDVSVNLYALYNYMKRTLIKAQSECDRQAVSQVKAQLDKLRASFYEASKQDDSQPLMKNTEKVYSGLTYSRYGANEMAQDTLGNRGFKA